MKEKEEEDRFMSRGAELIMDINLTILFYFCLALSMCGFWPFG